MTIAIVSEGGCGKTCTARFRAILFLPVPVAKEKDFIVKKKINYTLRRLSPWGLLAAFALAFNLGCATLGPPAPPEQPARASHASYKVIFGTTEGNVPEIYEGVLDGNITVQDALQASGALNKFRKGMTVDLARRLETGRVLKMPVNYDSKSKQVMEEQNYAIHPGDEILVRREDNGMFQAVFGNMKGPF